MAMPITVPRFTTDKLRQFPQDGNRYELLEGMLLVTPAPGPLHQIVLARLSAPIQAYLSSAYLAIAVGPGEIEVPPGTLLDPDLLVIPNDVPPITPWTKRKGWWLAVEVFSRSSRTYDQQFKRDAYLALGVREVWLVDIREKRVLVSRPNEPRDVPVTGVLQWHPLEMPAPMLLDLREVFLDIP